VPTPDQLGSIRRTGNGVCYTGRSPVRLIVKKRNGLGWTLNFASPRANMLLGANILVGIGLSAVIARSA